MLGLTMRATTRRVTCLVAGSAVGSQRVVSFWPPNPVVCGGQVFAAGKKRGRVIVEFDPFSGNGLDTLELVWEPYVNKFGMAPPLVVCCVRRAGALSTIPASKGGRHSRVSCYPFCSALRTQVGLRATSDKCHEETCRRPRTQLKRGLDCGVRAIYLTLGLQSSIHCAACEGCHYRRHGIRLVVGDLARHHEQCDGQDQPQRPLGDADGEIAADENARQRADQ
jgi:hypothetical protein